ncbi:MAG: MFS transporter [Promethearchaeota archaeon]|jgi:DHA1 family bicyclomycin/chloramphenicol resistance-like MFS transporter
MSSDSRNKKEIIDSSRKPRFLEVVIYVLFFFGPLTGNVIVVLFHTLATEFSVTQSSILVAIPAFMFPFAITQLFSGAISDIKGRFPVLLFGLVLFGIGMILAASSISIEMYAVANILSGIGFGFINPVLIALMTDITAPPNIPKKMGYLGASANLGVGVGPVIASQMIAIGWRSIYILFIAITIFGFVYLITTKRPPQKISSEIGVRTLFSQLSVELRRLVVVIMIFSAFLISHTYLALNIWTSRILSGPPPVIDESIVGFILGIAGVGAAITGGLTGLIIKKKDPAIPLIIGFILMFVSLAILLLIGDITQPQVFIYLAVGWIIAGLAGGILFPVITYYSQILSPARRGALAGLLTAGYFIGIALVPTTLAPIYSKFGVTGIYLTILGISILFVITVILLYLLERRFNRNEAPH